MKKQGAADVTNAIWFWLAIAAVTLGLYARLRGLGRWPLAEDEFFMARSIAHLAEHGVPALDCRTGGHYLRGIAYQLLVAPLFAIGISAETALRAVSVVANLAAIPALALLGRRIGSIPVAAITIVLFALSTWEVEFARFGRMYAPFQAIFVWHLFFLQRNALERGPQWPLLVLTVAGVATWEGGIFLACLNFLPLFLQGRAPRLREWLGAGLVFAAAAAFLLSHEAPPASALPPGIAQAAGKAVVLLPRVLALTLPQAPAWAAAALLPAAICVWALHRCARARAMPAGTRLVLAVLIVLAFLNQWLGILASFAMGALLGWISVRVLLRSRPGRGAMLAVVANGVFWLVFGLFSDAWHSLLPAFDEAARLRKLGVVFLKFPEIFDSIVLRWAEALPVFSLILALFLPAVTVLAMGGSDRQAQRQRFLLAVLLASVLLVGLLPTRYVSTRYTFFLMPLVLLLTVATLNGFARGIARRLSVQQGVLAAGLVLVCVLSEDVSLRHLLTVDRMETNFRLTAAVPEHYYVRSDYRGPARYVESRRSDGDLVISGLLPVSWYLSELDYVYVNQRRGEFRGISCAGGQREKWTGKRLLYSPEAVAEAIAAADGRVWLLLDAQAQERGEFDHAIFRRFAEHIVHVSVDGRINVYRIDATQIP